VILGSCAGYFGYYLFEKECKILHVEHEHKPRDRDSKSDNEGPLDMDV
jgi:hypothetical protein